MFASQLHAFAQNLPHVYRAVILTFLMGSSLLGENQPSPTRYVTRFESQRTVEYQPRMRVVEQTVARPSWNPFRSGTRYEKRLVPVVSWVAREVDRRMPVTDRVAMQENSTQDHRAVEKKKTRLVAHKEGWQTSGVKSIDRVPTRNFQTRPIDDFNTRETEPTHSSSSGSFGGVQRFDSDLPRIGMRSQVHR